MNNLAIDNIILHIFEKGCSYFFLVNLPTIDWLKMGLDPSWAFAISDATYKQLIFGKDIVFTYGPLGYLIHGTSLNHNFSQIIY